MEDFYFAGVASFDAAAEDRLKLVRRASMAVHLVRI